MKTLLITFCLAVFCAAANPFASDCHAHEHDKTRVLLLTGQHNHDWKATTPVMVDLIERSGRIEVTVEEEPWDIDAKVFADYDVVLSNWGHWPKTDADPWSDEVKKAFLTFVEEGGGLVVVHAGSSVNYQFPEFQELVGRTWIRRKTTHYKKHRFEVKAKGKHPITAGIEKFEIYDELWRYMVPTGEYEVHAVADTSRDQKNQGPEEPVLLTTKRGKGRGVNLVIGHDLRSMASPEWQQLFLRSLEWAGTGNTASFELAEPATAAAE